MGKGTDSPKHEPKPWDCKHATFPNFNVDMQGVSSHLHLMYIMETARVMFDKYNTLSETAKATNRMALFKTKWSEYTMPEDIKMMTEILQDHYNGRVIMRLSVMRSTIIKNTFGTAYPKSFTKAGQGSEEAFKAAMDTTMEDHMLDNQR
eukprot:2932430-Rhodomonas_salina.1